MPHVNDATWQAWESRIAEIDRRLAPVAKRPVSVDALDDPVADADKRSLADVARANQDLLSELIDSYASAVEADRARIRRLFVEHSSFAWAVGYVMSAYTDAELRRYVIYLSMLDQGFDTRDYLLTIRHAVANARRHGLDYRAIMRDVAEMSSRVDRYGMGTTQDILRNEGS